MQLHKMVEKTVIKREHKMVDHDRHRDNYTKAQSKPNRTAEDDRKLIKVTTRNLFSLFVTCHEILILCQYFWD